MVKAMILDVDGVIIGEKEGVNVPHPHPDVITKLRAAAVPVALCTAKPAFAIDRIIKDAKLDNPHIADAGGVLVGAGNTVLKKCTLESDAVQQIVRTLLEKNIHVEVYTAADYYVQGDRMCDMVEKHAMTLQRMPVLVDLLEMFSECEDVTKIVAVTPSEDMTDGVKAILRPFEARVSVSWSIHPAILPIQFGVITTSGITKRQGAIDISEMLGVPLENIMGVGDGLNDWQFIEICGYGAAMGNSSEGLKELVRSKGSEHGYVGKHVDENGIIDIIDWGMSR